MKDVIILAIYINVGNLNEEDARSYVSQATKSMQWNEEDNIRAIFIPVRDQETKIECVYPKYVTQKDVDADYDKMLSRLKKLIP